MKKIVHQVFMLIFSVVCVVIIQASPSVQADNLPEFQRLIEKLPASTTYLFDLAYVSGTPTEASFFEAFGQHPDTAAIPVEDFEAIALAVSEDEDGAAPWIDLEFFFGHLPETVEAFAHVAGIEADPDFDV
jgi:hypothetical protein